MCVCVLCPALCVCARPALSAPHAPSAALYPAAGTRWQWQWQQRGRRAGGAASGACGWAFGCACPCARTYTPARTLSRASLALPSHTRVSLQRTSTTACSPRRGRKWMRRRATCTASRACEAQRSASAAQVGLRSRVRLVCVFVHRARTPRQSLHAPSAALYPAAAHTLAARGRCAGGAAAGACGWACACAAPCLCPCSRPHAAHSHALSRTRARTLYTHSRSRVAGSVNKVDEHGVSTKDKKAAGGA